MSGARNRLVVVSNRGPYRVVTSGGMRRRVRADGGLVTALDPVLQARGGVWVSADESEAQTLPDVRGTRLGYELATVALSRPERDGFYLGLSNAVLWPVLHGLPPTVRMGQPTWEQYEAANRAFAKAVLDVTDARDPVWVHDYHLMLVPNLLRERRRGARIGWFCHVPWPGPDTFEILPWREQILAGLLGADVLAFHTEGYVLHFLRCVAELFPAARVDVRRRRIDFQGRSIHVFSAPIGIPLDQIAAAAAQPKVDAEVARIRAVSQGRRILLGVDRLDYTKGIPQRMLAFEQLLRSDRTARERYVLMQVMVPSRTDVRAYRDLKADIDELVGDINGRHASAGRMPIHYFYRALPPDELYAHYRAADVALVTPLRDGMNLVSLEFVHCRSDENGVLVLSEFAGAARYLDDALLVNPHDVHGMARALQDALAMPPEEVKRRMRRMRAQVRKMDVQRWADDVLEALEGPRAKS